jgi:hypothetical protein
VVAVAVVMVVYPHLNTFTNSPISPILPHIHPNFFEQEKNGVWEFSYILHFEPLILFLSL